MQVILLLLAQLAHLPLDPAGEVGPALEVLERREFGGGLVVHHLPPLQRRQHHALLAGRRLVGDHLSLRPDLIHQPLVQLRAVFLFFPVKDHPGALRRREQVRVLEGGEVDPDRLFQAVEGL